LKLLKKFIKNQFGTNTILKYKETTINQEEKVSAKDSTMEKIS
jgi:hypothetical protein